MPSEFDLIRRHFSPVTTHTDLAGGDDAALLRPTPGMQLVVSSDMLVAGTHFLADTDPEPLGWKTLAVNLSDIAAMGAKPRWATLALSLPHADEDWIRRFADGFLACASRYGVDLIGGDTTRGPLTLCVTIFGEVPAGEAITRSGACAGDDLWVTGQPGLAALGLACLTENLALSEPARSRCLDALLRPSPRVEAGLALRGLATAMLDISDGLLGDLGHLLARSGVGATVEVDSLPLAAATAGGVAPERARSALLTGGDDYELLFAAPADKRGALVCLSNALALPFTRIGHLTGEAGELRLREPDGTLTTPARLGYDHFRQ